MCERERESVCVCVCVCVALERAEGYPAGLNPGSAGAGLAPGNLPCHPPLLQAIFLRMAPTKVIILQLNLIEDIGALRYCIPHSVWEG